MVVAAWHRFDNYDDNTIVYLYMVITDPKKRQISDEVLKNTFQNLPDVKTTVVYVSPYGPPPNTDPNQETKHTPLEYKVPIVRYEVKWPQFMKLIECKFNNGISECVL